MHPEMANRTTILGTCMLDGKEVSTNMIFLFSLLVFIYNQDYLPSFHLRLPGNSIYCALFSWWTICFSSLWPFDSIFFVLVSVSFLLLHESLLMIHFLLRRIFFPLLFFCKYSTTSCSYITDLLNSRY